MVIKCICTKKRKFVQILIFQLTPKIIGNFPMKTIKSKFFMICIVAISIVYLQQLPTLANSVTVGDYTLTVSKGSPAHSPEAPTTMRTDNKNKSITERRIKVNFSLKIEKRTARGVEDISADVKNCLYEMSLSTGATFYSSNPLYLAYQPPPPPGSLHLIPTPNIYTINSRRVYPSVTHIIEANTVGHKALLMRVTVTMKDGTVLTAFASNSFDVCEYVITVYSYVGDINNRLVSNGYLYKVGAAMWGDVVTKSVGHASWQIEINDPSKLSTTTKWTKYVNIPCGFSVTSSGKNTFLANLQTFPASGLSVIAPGDLLKNDKTGGTNKQFKMTKVQTETALDKTLDIDTTKPNYILHSNNCVDSCMAVAKEGGVTFKTTCRWFVTIKKGRDKRTAEISLPSELVNELK
jgi:hypothetical protein